MIWAAFQAIRYNSAHPHAPSLGGVSTAILAAPTSVPSLPLHFTPHAKISKDAEVLSNIAKD